MILQRLFKRKVNSSAALYDAIVAAARQPEMFITHDLPDTLDGRFDVLVLHLFLVLERLKSEPEHIKQDLIDYFFLEMDRNLREMGVGDVSVGKKVRKMAEAFYGRIKAYSSSLELDKAALAESLQRNIYAGIKNPKAAGLALWVIAARKNLETQSTSDILKAKVSFA